MPSLGWIIRSWQSDDSERFNLLRDAVTAYHPPDASGFDWHGQPNLQSGQQSSTLCAVQAGAVVGVGTVFESPVAPMRWRLALHVDPSHRRRGIGSALLRGLRAHVAGWDRRELQVGLGADAVAGLAFLDRHGFRPLMRTRLGTVQPERIPRATWDRFAGNLDYVRARGVDLVPYTALHDIGVSIASIAEAHRRVYRQTHAWSPLASLSPERAASLFLGDNLIPDGQFVAVLGGHPIGVSSVRRSAEAGGFDLGWTGCLGETRTPVAELTAALLGRSLVFARSRQVQLNIEVDESDVMLWALVEQLPLDVGPDWLNLEWASDGEAS